MTDCGMADTARRLQILLARVDSRTSAEVRNRIRDAVHATLHKLKAGDANEGLRRGLRHLEASLELEPLLRRLGTS